MAIALQETTSAVATRALRARRYALVASLLGLVVLTAWLSARHAFVTTDSIVLDLTARLFPRPGDGLSQLLVIELGRADLTTADAVALGEAVGRYDPALVALNFLPSRALVEALRREAPRVAVVAGAPLLRHPASGAVAGVRPLPADLEAAGVTAGVSAAPAPTFGIVRYGRLHDDVAGVGRRTLEGAVLAAIDAGADDGEPYLVDFTDGGRGIPVLDAERVVDGNVVASMLEGKIVLIGFQQGLREAGIHSPASGPRQTTALVRYQAQSIETRLDDRSISVIGFNVTCGILLLQLLAALFVYQHLDAQRSIGATVLFFAGIAIASFPLLVYAHVLLPLTALAIVQLITFAAILLRKITRGERVLQRWLLDTSNRLRDRLVPASFYASAEPWQEVAQLLSQTLELRRMIFLEKIEGDHRVREVHSWNCDLDEVDERRRDYERTPYSTAISTRAPLRLARPYLKDRGDDDVQYLVCLNFGGEIIGFWAFSVSVDAVPDPVHFAVIVHDFAEQISEMLHHRQRWLEQRRVAQLATLRYLRIEAWTDTQQAFQRSLALMEKRLATLEHVFDGMGTAAVLYDLFGHVVHVNQRMEALLRRADLAFFSMNSVEVIAAISGKSIPEVRQYLHYVIVERTKIGLPAPLLDSVNQTFLLQLRPLERQAVISDDALPGDAQPFHLGGVLIEAQDVSAFRTLHDLQDQVVNHLDLRLRNDLESLLLGLDLIEQADGAVDARLPGMLREKIGSTVSAFESVQQYLYFNLDFDAIESYPVDWRPIMDAALEAAAPALRRRNVQVQRDEPRVTPLVIGAPETLEACFQAFVEVLADDARAGSSLRLDVSTIAGAVRFRFSNDGFGIPDERFQGYLFDDSASRFDEFRRVRNAIRFVQGWGGEIAPRSELGRGIEIELSLKSFLL